MEHKVTVAIIGGGPAGASCGITLLKNGIDCCVVDRAVFPRRKACAGLVTEKTYRQLEKLFDHHPEILPSLFVNETNRAVLYDGFRPIAAADCELKFRLADRFFFDRILIETFRNDGGLLLEGQEPLRIDYKNNQIVLKNQDTICYQFLIFADGALSRAHRDFSLKRENYAFCIETFFPNPEPENNKIQMHFGSVSFGYIWLFPYGDRLGAGVGSSVDKADICRKKLEEFLEELGVDTSELSFRGAYVPNGKPIPQNATPDNVLLIGDAGGFVDPVLSEGLFFAIRSGILAAEAISGPAPKTAFLRGMEPACKMMRSGLRLQKYIFTPHIYRKLMKNGAGKDRFLTFYCDRQVSLGSYLHTDPRLITDYKAARSLRSESSSSLS